MEAKSGGMLAFEDVSILSNAVDKNRQSSVNHALRVLRNYTVPRVAYLFNAFLRPIVLSSTRRVSSLWFSQSGEMKLLYYVASFQRISWFNNMNDGMGFKSGSFAPIFKMHDDTEVRVATIVWADLINSAWRFFVVGRPAYPFHGEMCLRLRLESFAGDLIGLSHSAPLKDSEHSVDSGRREDQESGYGRHSIVVFSQPNEAGIQDDFNFHWQYLPLGIGSLLAGIYGVCLLIYALSDEGTGIILLKGLGLSVGGWLAGVFFLIHWLYQG